MGVRGSFGPPWAILWHPIFAWFLPYFCCFTICSPTPYGSAIARFGQRMLLLVTARMDNPTMSWTMVFMDRFWRFKHQWKAQNVHHTVRPVIIILWDYTPIRAVGEWGGLPNHSVLYMTLAVQQALWKQSFEYHYINETQFNQWISWSSQNVWVCSVALPNWEQVLLYQIQYLIQQHLSLIQQHLSQVVKHCSWTLNVAGSTLLSLTNTRGQILSFFHVGS